MSRAEAEGALGRLRPLAVAEIARLDLERRKLLSLIEFIDEYASGRKVRPRRRRSQPASPAALIAERPGIRTTMIAMVLARPSEDVAAQLREEERCGRIERQGLGWRVSGAQ